MTPDAEHPVPECLAPVLDVECHHDARDGHHADRDDTRHGTEAAHKDAEGVAEARHFGVEALRDVTKIGGSKDRCLHQDEQEDDQDRRLCGFFDLHWGSPLPIKDRT